MATADLSWLEFSPGANASISWLEFEATAPTATADLSWLEFSTPVVPTTASVSWLEFLPPSPSASVSWLEFVATAAPAVYTLTAETGSYLMSWAGSESQIVLDAESGSYTVVGIDAALNLGAAADYILVAEAGSYSMSWQDANLIGPLDMGASAAAIWSYILPNGLPAGQVFSEIHSWLAELHKIHGLTPGYPMSVTQTSRTVGDIAQAIFDSSGVVTVTRQ